VIELQDKHGEIARPLWFPFPMSADIYRTTRVRGFSGGLPADSFRIRFGSGRLGPATNLSLLAIFRITVVRTTQSCAKA